MRKRRGHDYVWFTNNASSEGPRSSMFGSYADHLQLALFSIKPTFLPVKSTSLPANVKLPTPQIVRVQSRRHHLIESG